LAIVTTWIDRGAYDIPLRCLLPRGLKRLLVAGRCISGTHVAHSSYRVTPIAMAAGHAAGVCAALGADTGAAPHDIEVREVQRELPRQGASLRPELRQQVEAERPPDEGRRPASDGVSRRPPGSADMHPGRRTPALALTWRLRRRIHLAVRPSPSRPPPKDFAPHMAGLGAFYVISAAAAAYLGPEYALAALLAGTVPTTAAVLTFATARRTEVRRAPARYVRTAAYRCLMSTFALEGPDGLFLHRLGVSGNGHGPLPGMIIPAASQRQRRPPR